jgi:hypothetical protein
MIKCSIKVDLQKMKRTWNTEKRQERYISLSRYQHFFFAHYREVRDPVTVSTVFNTFSLTITDSLYSYQMGKESAISHLKHIFL